MSTHVSMIVPAYNAETTILPCLKALLAEADRHSEILVVDDGSTDRTANIARELGVTVLSTPRARSGPAAARNLGAQQAFGDILFFVDSDVVVHPGTVSLVRKTFQERADVAAIFGTYDDSPAEQNFFSQYKNLLHHFVHQTSEVNAQTFWAGCGAIRKSIFLLSKGFDAKAYSHPSIEDIELGIRLKSAGHRIWLEKNLQGKHLKRWTSLSLLKADVLYRAYPWSKLIAEEGKVPNDLNLHFSQRISSVLAALFLLIAPASILLKSWMLAAGAAMMVMLLVLLNRELFSFFLRKKGAAFTVGAIFWHMFYYVYSAIIFVYCWVRFRHFDSGSRRPAQSEGVQPHLNPDKPRY